RLAESNPRARYLVIPMARGVDEQALLRSDYAPKATEEPQIVFRSDAQDRFDEQLRYGNRPKAELLACLGVPGPWQQWPGTAWEKRRRTRAQDIGLFVQGGWVARLDAGASDAVEAHGRSRF